MTSTNGGTMLKKVSICSLLVFSMNTFAIDMVQQAHQLKMDSQRILELAERIEYGNTRGNEARAERKLKKKLRELIDTATELKLSLRGNPDYRPGPVPRPTPRPIPRPVPSPRGAQLVAECHIDDDPDLTLDQEVVTVKARSVQGLIAECQMMEDAMYPRKSSSSGIVKVQLEGPAPRGLQSAVCHIDDDPDLTFDQVVIGTLYGSKVSMIQKDCEALGQSAYGSQSSAGLKNVNANVNLSRTMSSATCHIDDDPDMTFDQIVIGTIYGHSIPELSQECEAMAIAMYGAQSASGLKDIRR